ncbi:alpha/beta hydrolase [Streptomyces sp. H39-S7]|uniref:alpha/beta hydrolase n=1 Tax=Streptomyces sp. H39-S7 TaxID=3004357 RepID=UPI0022AE9ADA|nr:alpha/beta hydrolase [Streptomyces sp. H39-S7]MCZ4124214.1 alpha/beta hydrolase [Streptomyces sp. H39-S7]
MTADIEMATELVYGTSGKRIDVHRPAASSSASPVVLLWHGRGGGERDVLAPLARSAARLGVLVLVPDWHPDAPDGGRSQLAESVTFARENAARFGGDPERMILAGWSLGANAVLGVALDPAALDPAVLDGWRPRAVVGISGGYRLPAPTTGTVPVLDATRSGEPVPPIPVHLVHGTTDSSVDIAQSRELRDALEERGWPVRLHEFATDHAGVIMAEYNVEHRRCLPSTANHAVDAGTRTARLLARAAGIPDS